MININQLSVYRGYDPTHTTVLRNTFASQMNRRFDELMKVIKISIVDNDCFGLALATFKMTPADEHQFAFRRNPDKVKKFMAWLDEQVKLGILEVSIYEQAGDAIEKAWTNMYITDSYKRGVMRARYEMKKAGYDVPSVESTGGIAASLAVPIHADRLGLLYTRTYTDLKGITEAMDTIISRILAQGMADGDNPKVLARKIYQVINGGAVGDLAMKDSLGRSISAKARAEMIARTEIIRAHHQAMIQEYMNWRVFDVMIEAEIATAGDNRVCTRCEALAKGGPYTLEQAMNLIPYHPKCRCVALPNVINKN